MRFDYDDGDADKESRFHVLRRTEMPAVLVEMAFLSNFGEEIWLTSPRWQARMAAALAEAVREWLEV